MRLEENRLVVSERNLRALLAKIEGYPNNSACEIRDGETNFGLHVEPDEIHYKDRRPGWMVDTTESKLAQDKKEN